MSYIFHILTIINIYLILSLSLNILVGYTGLLALCHAAFFGIGAYISALLTTKLGINFLLSLVPAIAGTALASYFISFPSVRLKGDYFILATLSFQIIVYYILYNWTELTGGAFGIKGIPYPKILGIEISEPQKYFFFSLAFASIVLGIVTILLSAPFGQVLKAIREDELLAKAIGKDVSRFKMNAFAISAGLAGLAGALFASYVSYIDPSSFTLNEAIFILSLVLLGGGGNIKGPIAGTFILLVLPEILKFLGIPDNIAPNVRQIIYGFLLMLFMYYRPQGIMGEYRMEAKRER